MKKFEINFYNIWSGNHFTLLSVDLYRATTATFLEIVICNFEIDITTRDDAQVKAQKKWDRNMERRINEWVLEDFTPKVKKAKKAVKKVAKKAK